MKGKCIYLKLLASDLSIRFQDFRFFILKKKLNRTKIKLFLSRSCSQNLGVSGFQNCPFCVKINYDNFYPILKLLYIIIFIKAAASFVAKVFPQSLFFHPYPQPTPFFSQKIAAAHSSLPFGFLRNGWKRNAIKRKRNDVSSSFPTNTKDKSTTWKIFSAKKKVEDVI